MGVQMSNTTVEQFAAELKRPVDDLLKQLKEAGVNKNSGSDSLTLDDKQTRTGTIFRFSRLMPAPNFNVLFP